MVLVRVIFYDLPYQYLFEVSSLDGIEPDQSVPFTSLL